MNLICRLLLLLGVFASFVSFHDQPLANELALRLKQYFTGNACSTLYLHCDKNIYSPGERIWFKAYVLSADVSDNTSIYVRLVDEDNKIIVRRQFLMNAFIGNGDLFLPETIKDGNYKLYAYTDRMINFNERDVFVQAIIVNRDDRKLEAQAFVSDTSQLFRGGKVQVTIRVKQGIDLLKNVKGTYQLKDGEEKIKSGKISTNLFGEAFINFVYPQLANDHTLNLLIDFHKGDEYAALKLNLPHEGSTYTINLFPEGGNLIDSLPSKCVVEVLDAKRNPVMGKVILSGKNGKVASTETGKLGLGTMKFIPFKNESYSLQLLTPGKKKTMNLSIPLNTSGYSITLDKQSGTLSARVRNIRAAENVTLVLRSARNILWNQDFRIPSGESLKARLETDSLPRAVLSLAVFDQEGKLLAERMFMCPGKDDNSLQLSTDRQVYGTRKKVTLMLNTLNSEGKPAPVNLSVAVVQRNTLDAEQYKTIRHSYLFSSLKGDLPPFSNTEGDDLDQALITKSWWADWAKVLTEPPVVAKALIPNTSGVNGIVVQTLKGKFDVKTVTLRSVRDSGFMYSFFLREDHTFFIPPEYLVVDDNDELYVKQSQDFRSAYTIYYSTPEREFDKRVQRGEMLFSPVAFNAFAVKKPSSQSVSLGRVIQLREVKITTKVPALNLQTGECTDFVCPVNILNCTGQHTAYSPGSFVPVPGGRYRYHDAIITYYGCDDYRFKSISKPAVFQLPDYEKEPEKDPEFGSTVLWKPNVNTGKNGRSTITFYSTDLKGDFVVVVQGIDVSNRKPFYAQATYSVN